MFEIRRYTQRDAPQVGTLIAISHSEFNLAEMPSQKRASMLGPFAFSSSPVPEHQEAITAAISAPSVWVATAQREIVGVLRGGRTDHRDRTVLSSLFVSGRHHRQGIGRALVKRFEEEYADQAVKIFTLAAALYAVPFYLSLGYKKSTGVRSTSSFGEPGLPYQPMRKTVKRAAG